MSGFDRCTSHHLKGAVVMPNYLTVESGPERGRRYELARGDHVLGRNPDCHIVIEVGAVSRRHAQITCEDDGHIITDLDSRNGTYVNGEAVQGRRKLAHGDLVRICDVTFSYFGADDSCLDSANESSSKSGQLVVDDMANSTVLSKLDVSSNRGGIRLSASSDAKLAAILEITQRLGQTVAVDDVLPKVLDSLFKIFVQADRAFVILADEHGNLVPRYSKLRRDDDNDTLRISSTIVNEVVESKQAVLSADASSDSRFELSESVANFRIRSMMCAPLIDSSGDVLGVLQIDTNDQKKKFERHDLEVLNSVASSAAIAIENAHLHEQALVQREVERDLEAARVIQQSFLPTARPVLDSYEFFDYYCPASQIGGDYYDYMTLPDGRFAVLIADVVGHGVAAALLMAKLSAEARICLATFPQLDVAVTELNQRFSRSSVSRFATMLVLALDPESHQLTIVNCGHMPPIIRRGDGAIDEPGSELAGIPVGISDDVQYQQCVDQVNEGDLVVLYTDGLNEAMDEQDQWYGMDRIRRFIAESEYSLQRMCQELIDDVRVHAVEGEQDDDMCLVCFGRQAAVTSNEDIRCTVS